MRERIANSKFPADLNVMEDILQKELQELLKELISNPLNMRQYLFFEMTNT